MKFLHISRGGEGFWEGGNGAQNGAILARESPESTQNRPQIAQFRPKLARVWPEKARGRLTVGLGERGEGFFGAERWCCGGWFVGEEEIFGLLNFCCTRQACFI